MVRRDLAGARIGLALQTELDLIRPAVAGLEGSLSPSLVRGPPASRSLASRSLAWRSLAWRAPGVGGTLVWGALDVEDPGFEGPHRARKIELNPAGPPGA